MRIPPSFGRIIKLPAIVTVVAISVIAAGSTAHIFTPQDKAYYADANTLNFVRPGLVLKVTSANVAMMEPSHERISIADPKGYPGSNGVETPGAVSISCVAALHPEGSNPIHCVHHPSSTSPSPTPRRRRRKDAGWNLYANGGRYIHVHLQHQGAREFRRDRHAYDRVPGAAKPREFEPRHELRRRGLTIRSERLESDDHPRRNQHPSCNKCHDQLRSTAEAGGVSNTA